jgi:hypothetical protein
MCGKVRIPEGLGTTLKPAMELIVVARRPLSGSVASNFLKHGTGVLNIDECRVPTDEVGRPRDDRRVDREDWRIGGGSSGSGAASPAGRYPPNVCHDGSPEVLEAFAAFGEKKAGHGGRDVRPTNANGNCYGLKDYKNHHRSGEHYGDTGTAARFFYCSKAPKSERVAADDGTRHPTQKPLALMRWLVKLACPPGGLVLDPFLGSGTTALACLETGRGCIGVERDPTYYAIAQRRLAAARGELFADASAAAAAAVS